MCIFSPGHNGAMLRALQLSTPTRSTRKYRQHPRYPPRPSQRLPARSRRTIPPDHLGIIYIFYIPDIWFGRNLVDYTLWKTPNFTRNPKTALPVNDVDTGRTNALRGRRSPIPKSTNHDWGVSKNSDQRFWISPCTTNFNPISPEFRRDLLGILQNSNTNFCEVLSRIAFRTVGGRGDSNKITPSHGTSPASRKGRKCHNFITLLDLSISFSC